MKPTWKALGALVAATVAATALITTPALAGPEPKPKPKAAVPKKPAAKKTTNTRVVYRTRVVYVEKGAPPAICRPNTNGRMIQGIWPSKSATTPEEQINSSIEKYLAVAMTDPVLLRAELLVMVNDTRWSRDLIDPNADFGSYKNLSPYGQKVAAELKRFLQQLVKDGDLTIGITPNSWENSGLRGCKNGKGAMAKVIVYPNPHKQPRPGLQFRLRYITEVKLADGTVRREEVVTRWAKDFVCANMRSEKAFDRRIWTWVPTPSAPAPQPPPVVVVVVPPAPQPPVTTIPVPVVTVPPAPVTTSPSTTSAPTTKAPTTTTAPTTPPPVVCPAVNDGTGRMTAVWTAPAASGQTGCTPCPKDVAVPGSGVQGTQEPVWSSGAKVWLCNKPPLPPGVATTAPPASSTPAPTTPTVSSSAPTTVATATTVVVATTVVPPLGGNGQPGATGGNTTVAPVTTAAPVTTRAPATTVAPSPVPVTTNPPQRNP